MLEMEDSDFPPNGALNFRDSETVWVLVRHTVTNEHFVLELTRTQVQEIQDNFDQEEN